MNEFRLKISSEDFLYLIKTRRVTRQFKKKKVNNEYLELILESAFWTPTGGNQRLNQYIVIQEADTLRKIRAVSPGMLSLPPVLIINCIDTNHSEGEEFFFDEQPLAFIDAGTALENMLLMTQVLGLGACPVMSFNKQSVQKLIGLPQYLVPFLMIMLGEPLKPHLVKPASIDINKFTHWEEYKKE